MDKITLNINELPKFNHNMMTIKERNSKDLQKAWKKFLREQEAKHGHKTIIGDAEDRPETLDGTTTAYSV